MGDLEMHRRVVATAIAVATLFVPYSVTDAAAPNPYLVMDINASGSSTPESLTKVNGTLFFSAKGLGGRELWKTNGTKAGTVRVKDIRHGPKGSRPALLTKAGPFLLFVSDDGTHGRELWKSDGTAPGTKLLKDIAPSGDSNPEELTALGSVLYFTAVGTGGRELWKSDGTATGTSRVKDIRPGPGGSVPLELTPVAGRLYFSADDGTHGRELWRSNGIGPGTHMVGDLDPSTGSDPEWLAALGENIFFRPTNGPTDSLWRYNESVGFVRLTNYGEAVALHHPIAVAGTLFFWARDGTDEGIWTSDGTDSDGTVMVATLPDGGISLYRAPPVAIGASVFFAISDGTNPDAIWVSDGTPGGTKQVEGTNPAESYPHSLTAVGGRLFFGAINLCIDRCYSNDELWTSDGTALGTERVANIWPGSPGSGPSALTRVGSSLYFAANDGTHGRELWRYVP